MLDITSLRQDFPLLQQKIKGKPVIYFDSACMSLRPQQVIEAITRYYTDYSACAGRSNHRLARAVSDEIEVARESIKKYIKAKKREEIVFTRNTTEGLNLVAHSLNLKASDVVLTSDKEHNSNLVPWQRLAKTKGVIHKIIASNEDNSFNQENYLDLLDDQVRLVAITQASNLDGVSFPIKEITEAAHEVGALVLVDAAQSAPHRKLDVKETNIDLAAFSGHKMLGPSGIGVLYGKYDLLEKLNGFMIGGDTVDYTTYEDYALLPPPEKFEAGLQHYAGIFGLKAATDYMQKLDEEEMHQHLALLNRIITEGIGDIDGLQIIGPNNPDERSGIVSFTIEGQDPHQIALLLDQSAGIMVRSGQHCVHSWFEDRGINGSVRASLHVYNTKEEAEIFVEQLNKIIQVI